MSHNGSPPIWTYGYVPSAAEWSQQWATKQDWSATLDQLIAQGGAPAVTAPGAWVPSDASGATLVFTGVSATYTQIGNIVYASLALTFPTTSNTSAAEIGGLPVPVPNAAYAQTPSIVFSLAGVSILAIPIEATSTLKLVNAVTGAAVLNVTLTGKAISLMLIYPAS